MPFFSQVVAATYVETNRGDEINYESRLIHLTRARLMHVVKKFFGFGLVIKRPVFETAEECTVDGLCVPIYN